MKHHAASLRQESFSFIISYFSFGFISAYNSILFCCLQCNVKPCCHTHGWVSNPSYAMQRMHTKNANVRKDRIDCVRCVFHVHALRISVFLSYCRACVHCIACVAYDSLESACTPMKMDLKVSFQAAVRTQCTQVM